MEVANGAAGSASERCAAGSRARIVSAAHTLFVNRGYRAVSIREIAVAAGLSHPGVLRHFHSKDQVLAAVIAAIKASNAERLTGWQATAEPDTLALSMIAAGNAEVPGYLALFAALSGEASTASHPAHEYMRARYRTLRSITAKAFVEAIVHDRVPFQRDAGGEAIRATAAWDGLQVMEQYLPDQVSVVQALQRYEQLVSYPPGWRGGAVLAPDSRRLAPGEATPGRRVTWDPGMREPDGAADLDDGAETGDGVGSAGNRVGRARREQILRAARDLFAARGYANTSLSDIAVRVDSSKATLLHHFGSKPGLLQAVLRERDREVSTRSRRQQFGHATEALRTLADGADRNARHAPGLIEVYAVLSCEAVPVDHPAHDYFAARYTRAVAALRDLLFTAQRDGQLSPHRDPEHEAVWLIALWDGLQFQWLYDRDAVDVAAHLRAHLADILPSQTRH